MFIAIVGDPQTNLAAVIPTIVHEGGLRATNDMPMLWCTKNCQGLAQGYTEPTLGNVRPVLRKHC